MSIASVFVSVEPLRRQKDTDCFVRVFCLVGVARLELAALRSRTVRATKLRYTPINMCFASICCGAFGSASRISVRSCALNNSFGDMFLFLKCTSFDSLNFSQTKLRYTPIFSCCQFWLPLQYTSIWAFLQQKQVNYLKNYVFCHYFFVTLIEIDCKTASGDI